MTKRTMPSPSGVGAALLVAVLALGCKAEGTSTPQEAGSTATALTSPGDFNDNTTRYIGKTISMKLMVGEMPSGKTLRDYVGDTATFKDVNVGLKVSIDIPPGLTVPNAGYLDSVLVTFDCTTGSTANGNKAKSVTRSAH